MLTLVLAKSGSRWFDVVQGWRCFAMEDGLANFDVVAHDLEGMEDGALSMHVSLGKMTGL